jgi:hypothetical protein
MPKVWGNTATGVLTCLGTRYYGKTKSGSLIKSEDFLGKLVHPPNGTLLWRASKKGGSCLR